MSLSKTNISILKNLSAINESMLIDKDEDVFVVSPCSSVIGYAKLDPHFDNDLCIYDMNQFLSVISLFEDAKLEFAEDGKSVNIGGGAQKVKYFLTDKSFVKKGKKLNMPSDSEIQFKLTSDVVDKVMKASAVLGLEYINISSDGEDVFVGTCNVGDDTSNNYSEKVSEGNGTPFNFYVKASKFKFMVTDYDVTCSSLNICEFKSDTITYWVGLETSSNYG